MNLGHCRRVLFHFWVGACLVVLPQVSVNATDDEENLSFAGAYRSGPKTTRMIGPTIEPFDSIEALRATLVKDADMRAKYKAPLNIAKASDKQEWQDKYNVRLDEEKRLVQVSCFLYAFKLENGEHGDNDFHLIAGDEEDGDKLLNVEVSGVPENSDKDALQAVRHDFVSMKNGHPHHKSGSYRMFDNPVPIRIVGPLYFDADHKAGSIGPSGMQPSTVWEIHPVQSIGEP